MDIGMPYDPWREHLALAILACAALLFVLVAPLLARERDHLLFTAAAALVAIGSGAVAWAHQGPEYLLPFLLIAAALAVPVGVSAALLWKLERSGRLPGLAVRSGITAAALLITAVVWFAAYISLLDVFLY